MKSTSIVADQRTRSFLSSDHLRGRAGESDEIVISCFENEVPLFVESELDRLYSNLYSNVARFKVYQRIENASTYIVSAGEKIVTIFLFCRDENRVRVINEAIKVDPKEIDQFARYIFSTYLTVDLIEFHAIEVHAGGIAFPCQRINCLEDIVLALPAKSEEYLASLGKATKKTINYYMNKLKRSFPSFRVSSFDGEHADEDHIRTIIGFNRLRMSRKSQISAFDDAETRRIIRLVKICGLVTVATIGEMVCAGSISYQVGENFFMHVSAHDSVYDDFRLGMLCRYLTVCECIAQGGKECHFLWGRQAFKFSLLGVQRDLYHLVVYRSRVRVMLNAAIACRVAARGMIRQVSLWAKSEQRKDDFLVQVAIKSFIYLKNRLRIHAPARHSNE